MTGQAPPLYPMPFQMQGSGPPTSNERYITPPPQAPVPLNEPPTITRPGDRLMWLVDQNYRALIARDIQLGNEVKDEGIHHKIMAINNALTAIKDETGGKDFVEWLRGKKQAQFKQAFQDALFETGDAVAAKNIAEKMHGYKPPILTLDTDPELYKYDYETLAAVNEENKSWLGEWIGKPLSYVATGAMQAGGELGAALLNLPGQIKRLQGSPAFKDFQGIKSKDVRATITAAMESIGSDTTSFDQAYGRAQAQEQVARQNRDWVANVLQKGGELTGELSMLFGGPAKTLLGLGKEAGTAASAAMKLSPRMAKLVDAGVRGATGFGLLGFAGTNADFGERLKAGGINALLGPFIEGAQAVGRMAYRSILGRAIQGQASQFLGKDATKAFQQVTDYATKNGIFRAAGEPVETYTRRLIDHYVAAGMPGMNLTADRIIATAAQGLTEAVGLTPLDQEFREDAYKALFQGDGEAFKRALGTMLGTGLGLAFLHYSGSFERMKYELRHEVRMPRPSRSAETPQVGPERQLPAETPADAEFSMQPGPTPPTGEGPPQLPRVSKTASDQAVKEFRDFVKESEAKDRFGVQDQPPQGPPPSPQTDPESSLAAEHTRQVQAETAIPMGYRGPDPSLMRLGWTESKESKEPDPIERAEGEGMIQRDYPEPSDTRRNMPFFDRPTYEQEIKNPLRTQPIYQPPVEKPMRRTIVYQDSEFAYDVEGEVGFPNEKLRSALKLPESMPIEKLERKLRKASILSALHSKALLPGQEITPHGWIAEPKKPGQERGKIRTIQFGEVKMRDLAPDGRWVRAEDGPAREPDQIPPAQEQVAQVVDQYAQQRQDLAPEDKAVLAGVSDVLNTVSGEKDPAVAETVQALQTGALDQALSADPQTAGQAIQAIGEMLTTKAPEVAIQELAAEEAEQAKKPKPKKWAKGSAARVDSEGNPIEPVEAKVRGPWAIHKTDDTLPQQYTLTHTPTGAAVRKSYHEKNLRILADRLDAAGGDPETISKQDAEKLWLPVVREWMAQKGDKYKISDESGVAASDFLTIIPETIAKTTAWVFDNPATRFLVEDWIGKVTRRFGEQLGSRFRRAVEKQHEYLNEPQAILRRMFKIARDLHPQLADKIWRKPGQKFALGHDGYQFYGETRLMSEFGADRSGLDPKALETVELQDEAHLTTREIANDLDMEIRNRVDPTTGHRHKVAATTSQRVRTRQLTYEGRRLLEDADFIADYAAALGKTVDELRQMLDQSGLLAPQSLHRTDAIETARNIPWMPSHVKDVRTGRETRMLETRPIEHTERLIRSFAIRAGMVDEFGPDIAPAGKGARQQAQMIGYQPYSAVVEQYAKTESDRALLAKAFRVLSGISDPLIDASLQPHFEWFDRMMQAPMTLYVAGKLSSIGSAVQNIFEPYGQGAAMLGLGRIFSAQKKIIQEFVAGRIESFIDNLIDEGGWTPMIHSRNVENVREAAARAGRLFMALFDSTQGWSDLTNRVALGLLVEDMEAGKGGWTSRTFLRMMDFSAADAERLAAGGGTPEEYQGVIERGMPRLSGRGSLPTEESIASRIAKSAYIPFFKYARLLGQNLQRIANEAKNEPDFNKRWELYGKMFQLVGMITAAGVFSTTAKDAARKGPLRALDLLAERASTDKWELFRLAFVGQWLGGAGDVAGEFIESLASNNPKESSEFYQRAASMIAPISGFIEVYSALKGVGPYYGRGPAGTAWVFGQRMLPILGEMDKGLLGFDALAIATDPQLMEARNKVYRWRERNGVEPSGVGVPTEFSDMVMEATNEIRSGRADTHVELGELASHLRRKAKEMGKDKQDVKKSLLGKRILEASWFNDLPHSKQVDLARFLGPDDLAAIKGHDAAIETLARLVKPDD